MFNTPVEHVLYLQFFYVMAYLLHHLLFPFSRDKLA